VGEHEQLKNVIIKIPDNEAVEIMSQYPGVAIVLQCPARGHEAKIYRR